VAGFIMNEPSWRVKTPTLTFFIEFKRRAPQLITHRVPDSDLDWYILMEHHGCYTRLLNWTDSALVGLFFAINSNAPTDTAVNTDAAVWMLDPSWLNRTVLRNGGGG
jgi:hypothetical protein